MGIEKGISGRTKRHMICLVKINITFDAWCSGANKGKLAFISILCSSRISLPEY
jgi:hypothetical protein